MSTGILRNDGKKWASGLIEIIERIRFCLKIISDRDFDEGSLWPFFESSLSFVLRASVFPKLKYTKALLIECGNLPPFANDQQIIEAWWLVAQDLLMLNTDGKPEVKFDELYAIGWYREGHASSTANIAAIPSNVDIEETPLNKGSANSNVRAAMFKRLKKEFYSIAGNLEKTAKTE